MKIAILGTRGVPARYGGFETLADQLSRRLVARGHQVTVYCRKPFTSPDDQVDKRIRRVILPTILNKYLDTTFHTFLSVIHVIFTDAELVLLCNVANSPLAWIPRLLGKPTILHVDGLDRKRRKWNFIGRAYLYLCELIALFTPTRIVTDARPIKRYFWKRYGRRSTMIAYGAEVPPASGNLEGFDLPSKRFILYVSRLEPENNPDLVIRAYQKVQTDWPFVVVGGNRYNHRFVGRLKSIADRRVIFTGAIYGEQYWQLLRNAGLYISACEVGGLHPALIEAMATKNAVLCLDTPENQETIGECGVIFRREVSDLAARMTTLLGDPGLREELGQRAQKRAKTFFGWDKVADKYEALFGRVLASKSHVPVWATASEGNGSSRKAAAPGLSPHVILSPVKDQPLELHALPAESKGKLTARLENHSASLRPDTRRLD